MTQSSQGLASLERFGATTTWITWTLSSGPTCPPYGCFEVESYSVGEDGRPVISGKVTGDTSKPSAINGPTEVSVGKKGRCLLDGPMVVAVSGSPGIGATIGPTAGVYTASTEGSGYTVFGAPHESKAIVIRAGGSGGAVLVRGLCHTDWEGAQPMDVSFVESYGANLENAVIDWYNTHNHVFAANADVIAVAKNENGRWRATIISAQESHYSCDEEVAAVIDGGDAQFPEDLGPVSPYDPS